MQKILWSVIFCALSIISLAQSKPAAKPLPVDPTKLTQADMQRLASMTPEEQAAWKAKMLKATEDKLKQTAKAANFTIDETLLPTTQLVPPVKDLKRLSALPSMPPTRQQLLAETAKMEAALKAATNPQTVQKVETFSASRAAKEIQQAAVGGWYDSNPEGALLLGMKAAQKDPSDVLNWNNLAALLNMSGLEQQAIPILQRCLADLPDNSMLLNNMGQAYMGLGDLSKARQFLNQCLSIDDLHPEANHSMALLHIYDNEFEKAVEYLQKEMEIAHRRSSLAQLVKSGHRDKINLAALRKKKMQRDGNGNRDFFEEINLGKFKIPDPPMRAEDSEPWKVNNEDLMQSITNEILFWNNQALNTDKDGKITAKQHPGIYSDLVNELIKDLGDKYIPTIGIIHEDDVPYLTQLIEDHAQKDKATPCPNPPLNSGNTPATFAAYEKKCCDIKSPLVDELMYKYNSFLHAKAKQAQSNYKQYINGLINIVQLDPSEGNKRMVYHNVAAYFTFMAQAVGGYLIKDRPMGCESKLTSKEAEALIESARSVDLKCPDWLKLNVSLKVAKLKADCNGYNIEADVYKLIQVGAEKKFKTGTSTLYVGAGISGKFKSFASGSIKQQFYIVFDNNNEFADLGMRGSASGDLASGAVGAEFSYDFAMNAGFNAQGKVKSNWITNYEKALNYVSKK
jgi:tetratricopeptide (TPR) repeat protein